MRLEGILWTVTGLKQTGRQLACTMQGCRGLYQQELNGWAANRH